MDAERSQALPRLALPRGVDRLHLACGRHVLDGYVNVDAQHHPQASRAPYTICDARQIPFDDVSFSEVLAIHIFEHFYLWEVHDLLVEWKRVLKPGGLLILELPDIKKCAAGFAATGDWKFMCGIYGDPKPRDPLNCHKWGWTPETLKSQLLDVGFTSVKFETPQWHPKGRHDRDMRALARL